MRFSLLFLSLLLTSTLCGQSFNALFIGNSYTFYNSMPDLVSSIAESKGDTLFTDSSTPGGYTLSDHTENANTLSKIEEGDWDYVIPQEQSQLPSFPIGQVESDCFPYAEELVEYVHEFNDCAIPVFFMTWGRENGDDWNCPNWPPVCTYEGMQDLLSERYLQMSFDNDAYFFAW